MSNLKAFVRLDFMTVKPYFTVKTILIYTAVALFLTASSENISSGLGVGLMISTLYIGYPFMLSEKSNMDALYATLSVSRNTVVLGRYIFVLLLNACTILFSLIMAAAGLLTAKAFGFGTGTESSLDAVIVLSVLFIVIQGIQLPLYFKLGYAKAKLLSIVPFAALMAGYIGLMAMRNVSSSLSEFAASVLNSGTIILIVIAILLLTSLVSYKLSLIFYKKREF